MARIRTIKPEFWTSEQIIFCSPVARLLFIGLWNFSDDAGIHSASYVRVKTEIFPIDSFTIDDIKYWINELIDSKLLFQYTVNEKVYWQVTGWKQHQRIDRPTFRHPSPESVLTTFPNSSMNEYGTSDEHTRSMPQVLSDSLSNVPRMSDERSLPDWNGLDRSGEEEDICVVKTVPCVVSEKSYATKPSREELMVFEYWCAVMQHEKAKLDKPRLAKIKHALKLGYSVEELKQAIDGCAKTRFNMGDNERNQRYDGIGVIMRDAEQIDRFISNAGNTLISSSSYAYLDDLSMGAL